MVFVTEEEKAVSLSSYQYKIIHFIFELVWPRINVLEKYLLYPLYPWNAIMLSEITTECHVAFIFYPLTLVFCLFGLGLVWVLLLLVFNVFYILECFYLSWFRAWIQINT